MTIVLNKSGILSESGSLAAPARHPANVTAELTFISPSAARPVLISSAVTGGAPDERFGTERHAVRVEDMRSLAGALSLDHEGFELHRAPTAVADLYDDAAVERTYHAETEALLRRVTGASRVVIFDATRRSDAAGGAANRDGSRGPAGRVHVDYTARSGPKRLADLVGADEARRLAATGVRAAQINVWRPIRGPVRRSPLALADASTVRPQHLVATDQIFPDRVGEIYHLRHDPSQRWYHAPLMTADEVLLIKGWDSLEDGRARFTPHSAFALADTTAATPARESIELRAYVIFA
ncbi:MAG: CmcJ/NvfI family oxidoreductase [Geminicoccaceae bacterium]|jgi:hypothetical protein|nr:CmcJ/NvfI family oxidoreductase [Geminicoccaceae bacterium]